MPTFPQILGVSRFIDAKQASRTQLLKQRGSPRLLSFYRFFLENVLLDVSLFAFTMPSNTRICLQQFFYMLSSFHFQSHNPKYSIKVRFPSESAFKNGGSRCCLEKMYLVKFTNQVDKWSTQYPFLKQSTRGETYAPLQNMQY